MTMLILLTLPVESRLSGDAADETNKLEPNNDGRNRRLPLRDEAIDSRDPFGISIPPGLKKSFSDVSLPRCLSERRRFGFSDECLSNDE